MLFPISFGFQTVKYLFDRKKLEKRNENFFSEKTDRKESCFAAFLPSALLI